MEQYGDALLCLRHRYDKLRRTRVKIVGLIVEERPLQPPFRFMDDDLVPVSVKFDETALGNKLKAAGGRWDPEEKFWKSGSVQFGVTPH